MKYSRGAIFVRFCYTSFPLVQCYPILLVQWFFHPSYWSSDFPPFLTVNVCSFRPIGPTFFVSSFLFIQRLFLPSYWSNIFCSFLPIGPEIVPSSYWSNVFCSLFFLSSRPDIRLIWWKTDNGYLAGYMVWPDTEYPAWYPAFFFNYCKPFFGVKFFLTLLTILYFILR